MSDVEINLTKKRDLVARYTTVGDSCRLTYRFTRLPVVDQDGERRLITPRPLEERRAIQAAVLNEFDIATQEMRKQLEKWTDLNLFD